MSRTSNSRWRLFAGRSSRRRHCLIPADVSICSEQLETRALLSGVTLLTHGFGGSVDDWVTAMADDIGRVTATDNPVYRIDVVEDTSTSDRPLTVTARQIRGLTPTDVDGDLEISLLLDWSDVAGAFLDFDTRPTGEVGAAVADAMLDADFLPELGFSAVNLPLHFIGHSRGGSVVLELARRLGEFGIQVDHVTTLDPHPVDGIRDPVGFDFGDAPLVVADNVRFADNYWRTDGDTSLDFTGEPITGSYNLQLDEGVLDDFVAYSNEHSDVHLWYDGTIDPTAAITDGSESVSEDEGWYAGDMGPRDQTGYYFSRITGGDRTAASKGLWQGEPNRTAVDRVGDQWPNVEGPLVEDDTVVAQGEDLSLTIGYQSTGDVTITVGYDNDSNPANGFTPLTQFDRLATSSISDAFDPGTTETFTAPTADLPLGHSYIYATIESGGNSRTVYSSTSVFVRDNLPVTFDFDQDGQAKPLTDGLLLLRYLAGFRGEPLFFQVVDFAGQRIDFEQLEARLDATAHLFDIDGNETIAPLSDGLLALRYMVGFTGDALTADAVDDGATRTEAQMLEYLSTFDPPASSADYTLQFNSTWSAETHPQDFPSLSAHFSSLIGATHGEAIDFWQAGELASPGIRNVAEFGTTTRLESEIDNANSGSVQEVIAGSGLGTSPGSVSVPFTASIKHYYVTLVSMIAPSPDWFVGVASLPLFENGEWKDSVTVEVFAYDAGTDSGLSYGSQNEITSPAEPIRRIEDGPFLVDGVVVPLGTFTFTRTVE